MATVFPSVFVSHGAPSLVLTPTPAREFLKELGRTLDETCGRPKAVLCASAHWTAKAPTLSGADTMTTIYDFYGFPDELYEITYPAPGDPDLARRAAVLLAESGLISAENPVRGLDHGAWVPLSLMYPEADVPVVQISVQPEADAAHHLALGRALAPLRSQGVLILASGGATHNLRDLRFPESEPADYARDFDRWLSEAVLAGREEALLDYLNTAPQARRNHPTPEHFLPLFVALGAGERARQLHASFAYGVLSMAAFTWS